MQFLCLFVKGKYVVDAGMEIHKKLHQPAPLSSGEKAQIVAHGTFCALQILDFGMMGMVNFAPERTAKMLGSAEQMHNLHIALNTAAGVAHATSSIISFGMKNQPTLDDLAKVAGIIVFRAADGLSTYQQSQTTTTPLQEWVATSLKVAITSVEVYTTREEYRKWGADACNHTFRMLNLIKRRINGIPVIIAPPQFENPIQMNKSYENRFNELSSWKDWDRIPDWLWDFPEFKLFTCSINERPTRIPCKPKGDKVQNIYYEKFEIMKWLKKAPNTPPPNWPSELKFSEENIVEDTQACLIVEENLKILLQAQFS